MSDFSLGYSGGSGGFLLLHLLLLSGQYHVEFKDNKSFAEAFAQQWKIPNPGQWKTSETWPDNLQTYNSQTALKKIYFYCNPYDSQTWAHYSKSSVILYTDYHSQTLLAHYKKANWYHKRNQPSCDLKFAAYRELLRNWRNHYNNIKISHWPECPSFRNINKLPQSIQTQILNNEYTAYYLNYQYHEPTETYCDQQVFNNIVPFLNSADVVVRLQDLINSNGSILEKALNIPPINHQQLTLLKDWKRLHPPELLQKIGITN
jgi:hypothetical protein